MIGSTPKHSDARALTRGPRHHFFGYYDKSPWDSTARYMLSLETNFMDRPPQPRDAATVGLIDLAHDCRWETIGHTHAWNWQQGCMLQWLGKVTDRLIIYNARHNGQFVSIIQDILTGTKQILPRPVYAVSNEGKFALSLNFARLHHMRPGYGYMGLQDASVHDPRPNNDGVYLMDISSGDCRLIVSIADIVDIEHQPSMDGAHHWFNHILLSPDEKRFAFLHRWIPMNERKQPVDVLDSFGHVVTHVAQIMRNVERKCNRNCLTDVIFRSLHIVSRRFRGSGPTLANQMLTANIDGSGAYCFQSDVSHFDWLDNERILAWAKVPEMGEGYYIFTDQSEQIKRVGKGVLNGDGHCSCFPGTHWFLTDTYPDQKRIQTLLIYDLVAGRRVNLGSFYSPPRLRGEFRCDLHPRWSPDGNQICFDSAHEGHRQMYVVDIAEIVQSPATDGRP